MLSIARLIHRLVLRTKAEELLVGLRGKAAIIRRFIPTELRHKFTSIGKLVPPASAYPKNDSYRVLRDKTNFKINRSDYVQWRLFYGVRDNVLKEAKKYLEPGSIVLDIGANFGAFSLRLAAYAKSKYPDVQIHAFEPNPHAFENFKINLALNPGLTPIIHPHPIGLGNETGERSFKYDNANTGAGRVIQNGMHGQFTVKVQRLDDFIDELNPAKVAFIKLIAEGFEPEILKGGWNAVKKYKPPIFVEVTKIWWEENNSTIEEVLDNLKSLGYRFMIEHYNEMLPYEPSMFSSRTQFNLMAAV